MTDLDNDLFELSTQLTPPVAETSNNDTKTLKEQEQKLRNDRFKSDTNWRCRLSWWVIIVDSVWLVAILVILFFNTLYVMLSDSVLLMLLGTTTVNVLGLAFIVLKGLFGNIDYPQK